MTRTATVSILVLTTLMIGCSNVATSTAAGVDAAATSVPSAAAAPATPGEGPCALLTHGVVQRVFPGATAGQLDRRHQQHGVLTCLWEHPTGRLSIIEGADKPQPVENEAQGWTLTFLDPLRRDASRHVRYETLTGVGDQAIAIVERADQTKGFIADGAVLVVQRGSRQVTLMAPGLARRERADALRVFEELGRAVASRLE